MPSAAPLELHTLREWVSASQSSREDALAGALRRIEALDPAIHAWVQVSPAPATGAGSLDGIPFGAKDIIETRGLATEYGSPIYRGRIGAGDAAIVSDLKQRGAVLLGKTHTAAFAYITPAPTRNPRDLEHTPGGSSSGSAAAVAAGMVPFALGTQTKGSVLRPASYCGVTGFKPTHGLFPMDGILAVAPTLDTLGFFTTSPEDTLALWNALGNALDRESGAGELPVFGAPERLPPVDAAMSAAFGEALSALRRAGARIRSLDLERMLAGIGEAAHVVMIYEGARIHRPRYEEHGSRLADLADLVRAGLDIPESRYDDARKYIDACKTKVAGMFERTPVILVPAATGPAPRGLSSTGDPAMNAPWTALGTPAISIPLPVGDRLPLGLQLTAAHGQDARLLRAAVRVHELLESAAGHGALSL